MWPSRRSGNRERWRRTVRGLPYVRWTGMRAATEPLAKRLSLLDVYAVGAGASLSVGFFLLPGLAAVEAGPALVLAYLVAVVPLVPAMLSIAELATAMPRAGGINYFLDRSLGPLVGTIGGIGTWLALVLKIAFALIGMGAYLEVLVPGLPIVPVALVLALAIGALNVHGTKSSGAFQVLLLGGLLTILAAFVAVGLPAVRAEPFEGFLEAGFEPIIAAAGLVFVSYMGLIKIASLAEEVRDPERTLPRGIFLALGTAVVVYGVGTSVIVGVVPMEALAGDLTAAASAARAIAGEAGMAVMAVAALLAFVAVANAGTLSASRYPLALGRDRLLPSALDHVGARGTPTRAIVVTVTAIVATIAALDPMRIAELASAFMLLVFALVCLAVIVMRESRIESYDPGYHSPLYPWMQIVGIAMPVSMIFEMGWLPIVFSLGLVLGAALWYALYARGRVEREGAMYHVFARWGRRRDEALDPELRQIMKEKGAREEDPLEELVTRAAVLDLPDDADYEEAVRRTAARLAEQIGELPVDLGERFLRESRVGATPVSHGAALPHLRVEGLESPRMALARSKPGIEPPEIDEEEAVGVAPEGPIHALFFLVSPVADSGPHLRVLAQIAARVEEEGFLADWLAAGDEQRLKETLLREERLLTLRLDRGAPSSALIDRRLGEVSLPEDSHVALVSRRDQVLAPHRDTILREGDRLTVIGTGKAIATFEERFGAG